MTIQMIPHMEASVDFTLFSCLWVPTSARLARPPTIPYPYLINLIVTHFLTHFVTRFVIMGSRGDGGGALRVMTLDDSGLKTLSRATSAKAFKCGTFAASSMEERRLTTGDFGGNLMTWDLERLDAGAVTQIGAHDQLINAIDGAGGLGVGHGAPEVVTASRDGKVKVWDLRATDRAAAVMQPSAQSQTRDAWAVAMGNDHSANANRFHN